MRFNLPNTTAFELKNLVKVQKNGSSDISSDVTIV